jgi:hypothetical protein
VSDLPESYSPEFDAALAAYYEAVDAHDAALRSGVRENIVATEESRRLAVAALRPPVEPGRTAAATSLDTEPTQEPVLAVAVHCDYCGVTQVPRPNGRCQNCGSQLVDKEPEKPRI